MQEAIFFNPGNYLILVQFAIIKLSEKKLEVKYFFILSSGQHFSADITKICQKRQLKRSNFVSRKNSLNINSPLLSFSVGTKLHNVTLKKSLFFLP